MAELWVANASPLIALANIGRLDLLTRLGHQVLVPPAVVREVRRGGTDLPSALALLGRVELVSSVVMWGLGDGESEVLSHAARSSGVVALLDDQAARRCAVAHGIPTRGTLGIVVLAKRLGLIRAAGPVFEALRGAGFHVSAAVVAAGLSAAGEA